MLILELPKNKDAVEKKRKNNKTILISRVIINKRVDRIVICIISEIINWSIIKEAYNFFEKYGAYKSKLYYI